MRQHLRTVAIVSTATLLSLPILATLSIRSPMAADRVQTQSPPQSSPTTDGSRVIDTPSAKQPEASSGSAAVTPPVFVLNTTLVSGVLGQQVRDAVNEDMGRIIDIIVDQSGATRAAVIDFGGFLGVGSRKIAVDWNALHFSSRDGHNSVTLELTRDQVKAAPEYQSGKPVTVLGALTNLDGSRFSSAAPER
jgi:hypothetical protein